MAGSGSAGWSWGRPANGWRRSSPEGAAPGLGCGAVAARGWPRYVADPADRALPGSRGDGLEKGTACRHLRAARASRSPPSASWSSIWRRAASRAPPGGSAPSTRSSASPTRICARCPMTARAASGPCWTAWPPASAGSRCSRTASRSRLPSRAAASASSPAASSSSAARRWRRCTRPAARCTPISTRSRRSPSPCASACWAWASSRSGGATRSPGCPRAATRSWAPTCPRSASSAWT